jgi:hypothetical protein
LAEFPKTSDCRLAHVFQSARFECETALSRTIFGVHFLKHLFGHFAHKVAQDPFYDTGVQMIRNAHAPRAALARGKHYLPNTRATMVARAIANLRNLSAGLRPETERSRNFVKSAITARGGRFQAMNLHWAHLRKLGRVKRLQIRP